MAEDTWNPWKMTVVGMMLVITTAVVTGLVVASWAPEEEHGMVETVVAARADRAAAVFPSRAETDACNQYAKAQAGDKAIEVVKDGGQGPGKGALNGGMVGPTAGTLHGVSESKKGDARYVEAYRACMKGRGFSS